MRDILACVPSMALGDTCASVRTQSTLAHESLRAKCALGDRPLLTNLPWGTEGDIWIGPGDMSMRYMVPLFPQWGMLTRDTPTNCTCPSIPSNYIGDPSVNLIMEK